MLEGKTVIVTGVGPGLGREVARVALRDGANVVLGARTEAKLEALAGELDPDGKRVAWRGTDIGDAGACAALVQTAVERFGGVDALAQVAALDALFGGVESTPLEDWQRSFDTNVLGNMHLVRAVVPALRERGGGSIVFVGSQSMMLPQLMQLAYAAAKGALQAAMYHLATELGPDKIRVNTVIPTWMWGPPVEAYIAFKAKKDGVPEEELVAEITKNMPLGEIPLDDDVAEAIAFFCSDRARMITGQSLLVNAGELMR